MTATRTTSIIAQTLIAAAFAIVVFGAVQAVATSKAAASSYTAPTYGSVMLERFRVRRAHTQCLRDSFYTPLG